MTRPRKEQVNISDTPYYHIVSRCVRRSFLCGTDARTGKSYEHRRDWIEQRIRLLSSIFAIDICAYAVMSNHLHVVVKLVPIQLDTLTPEEVVQRWTCLFKGPSLIQQWRDGKTLDAAALATVHSLVEVYRRRLSNLGWFMKCLSEPIARQANKEDDCTGHFWEARYKSQALLTEEALLTCMAYVDLNPVRADIATTPETSDYTSVKERIAPSFDLKIAVKEQIALESLLKFDVPLKPLTVFEGNANNQEKSGILFSLDDYLTLVDITGRFVRDDKRGAIPPDLPSILARVRLNEATWLDDATQFEKNYRVRFSRRARERSTAA